MIKIGPAKDDYVNEEMVMSVSRYENNRRRGRTKPLAELVERAKSEGRCFVLTRGNPQHSAIVMENGVIYISPVLAETIVARIHDARKGNVD